MASPCIISYKGKDYTYDQWQQELHDGLLDKFVSEDVVKVEGESPRLSGIKKALVPEGVIDATGIDRRSASEMLEQGKQAIESGQVDAKAIINEINQNPRALQPIEVAALVYYKATLDNKIEAQYSEKADAVKSNDYEGELAANAKIARLEQDLMDYELMSLKTAYEQSLAFRLRKMLLDNQYALQSQVNRYKANNNGVIPQEVREKFEKLDAELKEANKKLEELEKMKKDWEQQQAVANIKEENTRTHQVDIKAKAKNIANKIRQGKTSRPSMFMSSSPAALAWDTAIEIAATTIEATGVVADGVQKAIKHIKSTDWYKKLSDSDKQKAESEVEKFLNKTTTAEVEFIDGKLKIPKSVIRGLVSEGITDIDELSKRVKDLISDEHPDITLREVRDAITGYGKTLNPNKEEIEVEIRRLKRVGRLISGLEDVRKKIRPLRSGLQRDKLTAEERLMTKELINEMKTLPQDQADLDKAFKTALDGIKSRLKNQIEEIKLRLETGQKIPKKEGVAYDAEALELKAERDALKEQLEALEGKQGITDEQRIKIAINSAEKTLKDLEQRIADKDFEKKVSKSAPETPELKALRDRVKKAREEYKTLKELEGVAEKERLDAYKKRTEKAIKALQDKIAKGDYSKKAKKPPMDWDAEALKLEAEKIKVKEKFDYEQEKARLKQRSGSEILWDGFLDLVNLPKTLLSSADMSAPFRQGLVFTSSRVFTHPLKTLNNFKEMFKMAFSEKYADDWLSQIKASPEYPLMKQSKLFLADQNAKLNAREEAMLSRWAKKIPILSPIAKGSERAYAGFLNKLRVDVFLEGTDKLTSLGFNPKTQPKVFKDWASYVNNSTGRGNLGAFETSAEKLSLAFFSPRLIAARFNTIGLTDLVTLGNGHYGKMDPIVRKMALKQTASFIGLGVLMMAMAKYYLDNDDDDKTSIETDPRSSDFGKIKLGNTRIDPWGGFVQPVRTASQVALGEKKKSNGDIIELGKKYGSPTRLGTAADYFLNKLAPIPSYVYRKLDPKPWDKNKTLTDDALGLVVPLYAQDAQKLIKEHGVDGAAILLGLSFFGTGVNIQESQVKQESKPQ